MGKLSIIAKYNHGIYRSFKNNSLVRQERTTRDGHPTVEKH